MKAKPLRNKIYLRSDGEFFYKDDLERAVQWLKLKLKNTYDLHMDFEESRGMFALIDEAFEDVVKK